MKQSYKKSEKILSIKKIWIPLLIGLIGFFFILSKKNAQILKNLEWESIKFFPLVSAVLFIAFRDIIFVFRLRELISKSLSWKSCLQIILLWDFACAVTPSVTGGGVAVYLLTKKGIKFGKAVSAILITTIADNLFFLAVSPAGYWAISKQSASTIHNTLKSLYILGLLIVLLYMIIIIKSLWKNPEFLKKLLRLFFKVKFLKKWEESSISYINDIIENSKELKNKKKSFWIKVFSYTVLAISSRYAVLNSIVASVISIDFIDHITIIGNQILLWKVMLLSPTPGSTGTAEFFFSELFSDILGDYLIYVQLLWRGLTYYLHILIGIFVLTKKIKEE